MRKKEVVQRVAYVSGCSQEVVRQVLDATDAVTQLEIAKGGEVMLFGLGKLVTKARGAKKARHMVTGERVVVPPRRVVLFRPSDALLAAANSGAVAASE